MVLSTHLISSFKKWQSFFSSFSCFIWCWDSLKSIIFPWKATLFSITSLPLISFSASVNVCMYKIDSYVLVGNLKLHIWNELYREITRQHKRQFFTSWYLFFCYNNTVANGNLIVTLTNALLWYRFLYNSSSLLNPLLAPFIWMIFDSYQSFFTTKTHFSKSPKIH